MIDTNPLLRINNSERQSGDIKTHMGGTFSPVAYSKPNTNPFKTAGSTAQYLHTQPFNLSPTKFNTMLMTNNEFSPVRT